MFLVNYYGPHCRPSTVNKIYLLIYRRRHSQGGQPARLATPMLPLGLPQAKACDTSVLKLDSGRATVVVLSEMQVS